MRFSFRNILVKLYEEVILEMGKTKWVDYLINLIFIIFCIL